MLKLTLKPGDFISIGEEIRVAFSGGSANNIHLLIDAPRELGIERNSKNRSHKAFSYYPEKGISKEAQQEIVQILKQERTKQKQLEMQQMSAGSRR